MIMKTKIVVCFAALLTVAATNVVVKQLEPLKAKLTIKVLDESGNPFPNVNVQLGFEDPKTRRNVLVEGKTDTDGLFTREGICDGSIAGSIQKDGYYMSGFPYKITGLEDGRWQPWNTTCVTTLRPIGKPVALYAKTVETQVPVLDQPCGYDLEKGDWVAPYGKGMTKDFIFTIHREVRGYLDFDSTGELSFVHPLDGLQEASIPDTGKYSVFKWNRQSPENGFLPTFQLCNSLHPSGKKPVRSFKSRDEWQGYYFRVRTVEQDGKIVSAHYGKIRGGIEIEPRESKTCTIIFTYYFNHTPNDRNLEWDIKKNLFSGLTDMETPREP
jgi:hypothetical protein